MVELNEFIRKSLVAIVRGVESANDDLNSSPAMINPPNCSFSDKYAIKRGHAQTNDLRVELIDFDVAVTATESENTKAGGAFAVAVIGGGISGTSEATNKSESRIRFTVPLLLPAASKSGGRIELRAGPLKECPPAVPVG